MGRGMTFPASSVLSVFGELTKLGLWLIASVIYFNISYRRQIVYQESFKVSLRQIRETWDNSTGRIWPWEDTAHIKYPQHVFAASKGGTSLCLLNHCYRECSNLTWSPNEFWHIWKLWLLLPRETLKSSSFYCSRLFTVYVSALKWVTQST